jgi:hypothetical protein
MTRGASPSTRRPAATAPAPSRGAVAGRYRRRLPACMRFLGHGIGTDLARPRDMFAATVGVPVGGWGLGTGRNGGPQRTIAVAARRQGRAVARVGAVARAGSRAVIGTVAHPGR